MKIPHHAILAVLLAAPLLLAGPVLAAEPDGLVLPPGFHATVVADGVGPVRHLAVRDNGDIYLSTGRGKLAAGTGIIALHLDANHRADKTEHFGAAAGTGIRFQGGALYAADTARVYRFSFHGDELVPSAQPGVVVDAMPESRAANHAIALDSKGNLYVSIDAMANLCTAPGDPKAVPVGLKPCPDLGVRAGIWRFAAGKSNQDFAKGELVATGIRDLNAMDIAADGTVYGFMHGRDTTSKQFPAIVSDADEANIADELDVVTKGTDFGWPYTYYDGVRKIRLAAPEYGGDGKTPVTGNNYATPVFTLQAKRPAPLDMVFYQGKSFPASYRGGSFVVLHGAGGGEAIEGGQTGDNVIFLPRGAGGKFGAPMLFAGGFAGTPQPGPDGRVTPQYRVTGAAVGPDGALYVADGGKGRVWRIAYGK